MAEGRHSSTETSGNLFHEHMKTDGVLQLTFDPSAKDKKERKPFDPEYIEIFRRAILARDSEMVKKALANGIDANTALQNGLHPLTALMYGIADAEASGKNYVNNKFRHGMSSTDFESETSLIVGMLLDAGVDLIDPNNYQSATMRTLACSMIRSTRTADLSLIMLHAIDQSLERYGLPYVADDELYVTPILEEAAKEKDADLAAITAAQVRHFKLMHDTVRRRLENPRSDLENRLAAVAKKIDFWTDEYNGRPIQAFVNNLSPRQLEHNGGMHQPVEDGTDTAKEKNQEKNKTDVSHLIVTLQKRNPEEVLADIDDLVGLSKYKEMVKSDALLAQFNAACRSVDMPASPQETGHMVLTANTGVGKTTLARLDAEYRYALGLTGPKFAEINRSKVVGQYIGETDAIIRKIIEEADSIFIDEAHTLIAGNVGGQNKQDYGNRVLEAVIPALENERAKKTFYFAGYPGEMNGFLDDDKGFRNRIGRFIQIDDPSAEDLGLSLTRLLTKQGRKITEDAMSFALEQMMEFKKQIGPSYFGNFRLIRRITEGVPRAMAQRLFGQKTGLVLVDKEILATVTKADIESINLKAIMGLEAKEAAERNTSNRPYQDTRVGFTAVKLGRNP